MSAKSVAPGAQQKRFAAYLDGLAQAAGHLDRTVPLKSYCTGLLLPGERKSVEPMAARCAPQKLRILQKNADLPRKILLRSSTGDRRGSDAMIDVDELSQVEPVGVSRPSRFGE